MALARALILGPRLLLLDEPLAALDTGARLGLRTDLRRHLVSYGGPAVVVTHDPVEAMVLADHLVVLERGRIVQAGRPAEIARRPRTDYVAGLVGLNLHRGAVRDGRVELDGGGVQTDAEPSTTGPVYLALRPSAVALHRDRPGRAARATPGRARSAASRRSATGSGSPSPARPTCSPTSPPTRSPTSTWPPEPRCGCRSRRPS